MKAAVYLRFPDREYRVDVAEDDRARHLFEAITGGRMMFCRAMAGAKNETRYVNAQQATEVVYFEYE